MVDTTCENIISEDTEKVTADPLKLESGLTSSTKEAAAVPLEEKPLDEKTKDTWPSIQSELKSAINSWADLSVKLADRKSPEELQLSEVRSILKDIKSKLKDFED